MGMSRAALLVTAAAVVIATAGGASARGQAPADAAAAHAPSSPAVDPRAGQAAEVFAAYRSMSAPGCAVSAWQDGKPVFEGGFGSADLEHDVPITTATVFEAGSVSKQFTAAAILLLVQDGKLRLGEDVRRWLPELPDYGRPITIEHLLTHTSGLRDWGELAAFQGWPRGSRAFTQDDVVDLIVRQRSLNYAPGAEYLYTNSGYNLLTEIVRRASGQSLADFTRARIFVPLGMKSTGWRDDYRRIVKNRAIAYGRAAGGFEQAMPFEDGYGNGGLLTTVGDLQIWNQALADRRLGGYLSAELPRRAVLSSGVRITYGRGLVVHEWLGREEMSHTGSTGGYRAWLGRYPAANLSVAVLCNRGDAQPLWLGRSVANLYLPPPRSDEQTTTLADAQGRAGLYVNDRTGRPMLLVATDGGLKVAGGETLWPLSGDSARHGADELTFQGRNAFVQQTFEGDRYMWRRTPAWFPATTELDAFVGVYRSEEIGVSYRVLKEGGQLVLRLESRPRQQIRMSPIYRDAFNLSGNLARFRRDSAGRVITLSLGSGRVRDLRFTRVG